MQAPGGQTSYGYDAGSMLTTITDPANGSFTIGHDAAGRPTSMTRPNGITDATTYDAAGDVTSVRSSLGATLVGQTAYTYNSTALRSSRTDLAGTTGYTYDGAAQLTSATPPAGAGLPTEHYTYDPAGNRTSSTTSPLGSFTYDSGDRLLGDAVNTYAYDNEGNLLRRTDRASGATTTYTWTAEHRLVRITYPDSTISTLRYDPLGRLVEIADATAVTRYAYDRRSIVAEYDATNTLAAHFVRAGEELPCPVEMIRDGQRYFYLVDGRPSTTALTDLSGAVVASYRYEAFGTPLVTGNLPNPFAYLCLFVYGIPGLGMSPDGPYDPGSGQFLNDNPISFPNPDPFQGPNPMVPPGDNGPGSGSGGGALGGGASDPSVGRQCTGSGPQIYPKGWKGLGKGAGKLMKYPKRAHPKGGAGSEYVSVLPTQKLIQAVADYGFVVRCQIAGRGERPRPVTVSRRWAARAAGS